MTKKIEKKFMFNDFGFPIVLSNVPMIKIMGQWTLDVDLNALQQIVLEHLATKKSPLIGAEIRFIRKYFEFTKTAFAQIAGVTHAAVVKWEAHDLDDAKIGLACETCIRLYILEKLHPNSQEFLSFYRMIVLRHKDKIKFVKEPISINIKDEFPLAS